MGKDEGEGFVEDGRQTSCAGEIRRHGRVDMRGRKVIVARQDRIRVAALGRNGPEAFDGAYVFVTLRDGERTPVA